MYLFGDRRKDILAYAILIIIWIAAFAIGFIIADMYIDDNYIVETAKIENYDENMRYIGDED